MQKKGFWAINLGVGIVKNFDGTIGSIFNKKVKVEGVEVYEYLGKCEIKKVESDLELKLGLKI